MNPYIFRMIKKADMLIMSFLCGLASSAGSMFYRKLVLRKEKKGS